MCLVKHLSYVLKTFRRTKRWILSREINKNSLKYSFYYHSIVPARNKHYSSVKMSLCSFANKYFLSSRFFFFFFVVTMNFHLTFGRNVICSFNDHMEHFKCFIIHTFRHSRLFRTMYHSPLIIPLLSASTENSGVFLKTICF